MDTLQSTDDLSSSLSILSDLGIKYIAADDYSLRPPRMTEDTLNCLYQQVREDELCILLSNGHFSTITKSNGIIFEFVTAEAMVDADPQTTWRTLLSVNGLGRC